MLPGMGEGLSVGGFTCHQCYLGALVTACATVGRIGGCHFWPEKPAFSCAFLSTRPVPPTETVPIALVPQEGWEKAV